MIKQSLLSLCICISLISCRQETPIDNLKQNIQQLIEGKSATVAVSIKGIDPNDAVSINGDQHLPMQSVFKLHIAATALYQIDQGKFRLQDSISLTPELISKYQKLWSPLREKYPEGGNITIKEIIEYTLAWSDNLGCDLLIDQIGGTAVAQQYMQEIGIDEVAIIDKEIIIQSDWSRQYHNWSSTNSCNKFLQSLYENKDLLSPSSYAFLWTTLKETTTGKGKIRGELPEETVVAHKTAYSGKNKEGIIGATNDIGIVFLPDDSYFYISIFVSDSQEEETVNQQLMADITKLAWDYFQTK